MKAAFALIASAAVLQSTNAQVATPFNCATQWNALNGLNLGAHCAIFCNGTTLSPTTIDTNIGTMTWTPFTDPQTTQPCGEPTAVIFTHSGVTGGIPSGLGTWNVVDFVFHAHDNAITGSIPLSLRQSTRVREVRLQNNQMNGNVADFISGWPNQLEELLLKGNPNIKGSYNDLKTFLYTQPKLVSFSIELDTSDFVGDAKGCLDLADILRQREANGVSAELLQTFSLDVPAEGICPETPNPTPSPITDAPTLPRDPTNAPTAGPTTPTAPPTDKPTSRPTFTPTVRPVQEPPTPVQHPTPRTLPPSGVDTLKKTSVVLTTIVLVLATAF